MINQIGEDFQAVNYMKTYDEIWSYTYEQIEAYLLDRGAIRDGSCRYIFDSCSVTLEAMPGRAVGPLTLPRTHVVIEGPGAEAFYHGFYMNFLSGGA